jgi:hypothetical protein
MVALLDGLRDIGGGIVDEMKRTGDDVYGRFEFGEL